MTENMYTVLGILSNKSNAERIGQQIQTCILDCRSLLVIQVDWLRGFLGPEGSTLTKAVLWAGIQPVPSRAGPLEAALRSKCVLLLAVTLKRRAVRYPSVVALPPNPPTPLPPRGGLQPPTLHSLHWSGRASCPTLEQPCVQHGN